MRLKPLGVTAALLATALFPSPAHAGRTVTITGGGWGHGIGMSQYGAYGRALNGRSATEILEHYYSGASVGAKRMPKVRVGLLQGRNGISLTSSSFKGGSGKVQWKVAGSSSKLAGGGPGVLWRVEPSATGGMRLYKGTRRVRRDGTRVFGSPSKPLVLIYQPLGTLVDVDDKTYDYRHGRLVFGTYPSASCSAGFCLRLVVALSMQKYLLGLAEVPSSWPGAVLRAQAIAGRTYAFEKFKRLGSHRYPCDCTVYDSVIDQAYAGDGKRSGSGTYWADWRAAVRDTNRQIARYEGAPIQTLYSSSSGGHTEHNEHVWGGTPLPYLRGVRDAPDDVSANPNHSWTPVKMPFKEFAGKVESKYNSIGDFQDIKVVKRGVSGRVSALDGGGLRIVGSQSTVQTSGWDFRTKFGSSILKDTLFYIDIEYDVGDNFLDAYRRLDGAPGPATTSPYSVPKGATSPLGKAQNFRIGRMTWDKETGKVVWQYGRVLKKYNRVGRESSKLGMPTSGIRGKRKGFLAGSYVNGIIFWSETTGAHQVRGAFFTTFKDVGGRSRMGLPTTDVKVTGSGHEQRFTDGTLYRPPKSAAVFGLWGPIDKRYRKLGAGSSQCGHPTASMVMDGAGAAATFKKGSITWTNDGGVKVNCG